MLLNEQGLIEADLVAEAMKRVPFSEAYSSDLTRASVVRVCWSRGEPVHASGESSSADTSIRSTWLAPVSLMFR